MIEGMRKPVAILGISLTMALLPAGVSAAEPQPHPFPPESGVVQINAANPLSHIYASPSLQAPAGTGQIRLMGNTRYETNQAVIAATVPAGRSVNTLILASGNNFPDALAGGALAAKLKAPLVLSPGSTLSGEAHALIASSHPRNVLLLGGERALTPSLSKQIQQISDTQIYRLSGSDRYQTAALASSAWNSSRSVFIATGAGFADALGAGAAAAVLDSMPLLLTSPDSLPGSTAEALRRLRPEEVFLVGGPSAISTTVEAAIRQARPNAAITRIGGNDRYETAQLLADRFFPQPPAVVVATGRSFPDALSAVPLAAVTKAPIVLARAARCMLSPTWDYVQAHGANQTFLVGGIGVLGPEPTSLCASANARVIEANSREATGCSGEEAAQRSQLPPDQRPWCPVGDYYGPVTTIPQLLGGAPLRKGSVGVKVKLLKTALGMNPWAYYDNAVVHRVQRFQQSAGLPATGVVDEATWYALNTGYGWNVDNWQAPVEVPARATRSQRVAKMINFATSRQGLPYTWGGAGDGALGYDCSGLVLQALHAAGVLPESLPIWRHTQHDTITTEIMLRDPRLQHLPYAQRQAGDLIFWGNSRGISSHVAIYMHDDYIVEATPPKIRIAKISTKRGSETLMPTILRPIADDRP